MKRKTRKVLGGINIGLSILTSFVTVFFILLFIWAEDNNTQWGMTAFLAGVVAGAFGFAGGALYGDGLWSKEEE